MSKLAKLAVGISVVGMAVLAAPMASAAPASPTDSTVAYCNSDGTPISADASADADVVSTCDQDQQVVALCYADGEDGTPLVLVTNEDDNSTGFASADSLTIDEPEAVTTCDTGDSYRGK
ncbi:hypothetical protein GCM10010174_20640 [Kutzneria viridogrisea]|uniref:Secreted protein n=2 Tax=Kutzneria TaxID=43356 RepID=W5WF90_9PSEU|nr:hypothetical protein [Kutzneria albida]AHH99425.1 hypothetical protein KALB_6065 [Kutzneria albida DSM 43870]MBA8923018.1 hypothetical protein [Kutzneria viridogrisea]